MFKRLSIGPLAGALGVCLAALFCFIGCTADSTPAANRTGKRYATFAPAVTQMLIDLGHAERIIAVGAFDPVKPVHAQVVGDLYRIDYEKLLNLQPTDVFLQPGQPGVPQRLKEIAQRHGWSIHSFAIETREDALRTLTEVVGPAIGEAEAARKLRETVERQLESLGKATNRPGTRAPDCLLVVGRNPLVCAGPETYMSEMLTAAGGKNMLSGSAGRYPVIDREKLLELRPEVMVWVRAGVPGGMGGDPRETLGLPESVSSRIVIVDDAAALLPGTSMPRVAASMARALHPELTAEIDAVMRPGP